MDIREALLYRKILGGGRGVMPAPDGYELVKNEFDFTPAVDSNPDIAVNHGLGVLPAYIIVSVNDVPSIMNNGKATFVAGFYFSGSGYAQYMNSEWETDGLAALTSQGGYYKRATESNKIRGEGGIYYIRNVNDDTFNLGYDGSYTWVAGVEIHVACFGFKKVVA